MKDLLITVDLKDCVTEKQVFDKFNEIFKFVKEPEYAEKWNLSWDGLDDFLWGYIQGPEEFNPEIKDAELKSIHIKLINSEHLKEVKAEMVRIEDWSIRKTLEDVFEKMNRQILLVEPHATNQPFFHSATFEIVS